MELTNKEVWTVVHGLVLGAVYLLAFTGGLIDLWELKPSILTGKGLRLHLKQLRIGMWLLTIISWLTVITGTYVIYPWYLEGPRVFLEGHEKLVEWDTFGMEWKAHVGWITPILMTCIAFIVSYYQRELIHYSNLRRILIFLFLVAFLAAVAAAVLGSFITKVAPINLGEYLWNAKNLIAT